MLWLPLKQILYQQIFENYVRCVHFVFMQYAYIYMCVYAYMYFYPSVWADHRKRQDIIRLCTTILIIVIHSLSLIT